MDIIGEIISHARMAIDVMLGGKTITIALAVAVVISFGLNGPVRKGQFRIRQLFLLTPLLLTAAIIIWGVILHHDTSSQTLAPRWPTYIIDSLLILHLPLAVVLVRQTRGHRWFASCVIALELWFSLCAAFVAGMSVTGDWL